MNRFNKKDFVGHLKLQGSNDHSSWSDLKTVDDNIHEGWNTLSFDEGSLPGFRYYRYFSNKSCKVGEIDFVGDEVIDHEEEDLTCDAVVDVNGYEHIISQLITYKGKYTPTIDNVTPRYCNVKGGEFIRIRGKNFGSNPNDIDVTIDDVPCTSVSFLSGDEI